MLVVDTNVLIHAVNVRSPFHDVSRAFLERHRTRPDAWYTTWGVIYEFLRVVTHPRVLNKPFSAAQAWSFVSALLASPGFGVLVESDRHASIAAAVIGELPHLAGNRMHDVHTAVLMREHGIRRICTRDTDFHRFPFLEVIDPV